MVIAVAEKAEETSPIYITACVAVPLMWGLMTEGVFRWLDRRHARRHPEDAEHTIEYHI